MRFLLFLLLLSLTSFAKDVNVKAFVSKSQVFVGDVFFYTVEVETDKSMKVELPSFVGNLGNFEIRDLKTSEESNGDLVKTVWKATLNTFVSGDFALAPQEVRVISSKDSLVLFTDPVVVRVSSRTTESDLDILEAEGPVSLPGTPWYVIALIVVFVLGLGVLIFLFVKHFKRDSVVKQLPPYEEAVLSLSLLQKKNIAESDQAQFFMELGLIARRYVERRFETEILDATVQELKHRMSHVKGLPESFKVGIVSFALETEPVKFAKVNLDVERVYYWENFVQEMVEKTKPEPEKEKSEKKK